MNQTLSVSSIFICVAVVEIDDKIHCSRERPTTKKLEDGLGRTTRNGMGNETESTALYEAAVGMVCGYSGVRAWPYGLFPNTT